jgi:hypothetical protein
MNRRDRLESELRHFRKMARIRFGMLILVKSHRTWPFCCPSSDKARQEHVMPATAAQNAIAVAGIDVRKNSFHIAALDDRDAIVLRQKGRVAGPALLTMIARKNQHCATHTAAEKPLAGSTVTRSNIQANMNVMPVGTRNGAGASRNSSVMAAISVGDKESPAPEKRGPPRRWEAAVGRVS